MVLTPEQKAEWIEALRSGKYTQGNSYLCQLKASGTKEYCCLGVLLEAVLHVPKTPLNPLSSVFDFEGHGTRFVEQGSTPLQSTLSGMNDGTSVNPSLKEVYKKYTFDEIADYIEKLKTIVL